MRRFIRFAVGCTAFVLACGWYYVGAAAPERHFEVALRALRANDVENVQYQLLAVEPSLKLEGQASLLRGWLLLQTRQSADRGEASALFEELNDAAIDDEEHRSLALAMLGRACYENGDLAEALIWLDKSLRLNPAELEAHRWSGIILYDLGLLNGAIAHLEEVARREPWNPRPHRLLGVIHRERGGNLGDAFAFQAAVEAFQESLQRDPNQSNIDALRVDLGRCLMFRNEWDEALAAVGPCFDSPDSLTLRAECYHAKGELERAVQCVDLALDQIPDNAHVLSVKATLAMAKRDVRGAAELLERAVRDKPGDYSLRFRLAQAYHHLGEEELAEQHQQAADRLLKFLEEEKSLARKAIKDTDPGIRYRLAELADLREPGSESGQAWLKAAQMLDSPALRGLITPPGAENTPHAEGPTGESPQ